MSDTGFFLLPTNKLYKKENTKSLKTFPAGYVGSFYRNLADRVDTSSGFFANIANDANIPKEDVQKYLLATSDFAKSMQTDINHYVTKDRINDASFRQKLDPTSKNIIIRQNPLELVFEDISTFDAKNPIVGSLLREIDIKKKKQSDSDFIKSLPSQPGKEFEIQKRLDRLRGIDRTNFNDNNNNSNPGGGTNLNNFNLGPPPSQPNIENFIENGAPPPPPFFPPGGTGQNISFNNVPIPPPRNNFNVISGNRPFALSNIDNNGKIGNNLFGSVGAMAGPRIESDPKPSQEIDDFLNELPDVGMPTLELGDKLLDTLGTEAEDLFNDMPTKKDEEDAILQKVIDEYNIPGMKEKMDETGKVPESIYFFYGGDS